MIAQMARHGSLRFGPTHRSLSFDCSSFTDFTDFSWGVSVFIASAISALLVALLATLARLLRLLARLLLVPALPPAALSALVRIVHCDTSLGLYSTNTNACGSPYVPSGLSAMFRSDC
jgi:hypothetical protein